MSVAALAREHLLGFLRALREAGIAAPAPKRADFLLSIAASPPQDVDAAVVFGNGRDLLRVVDRVAQLLGQHPLDDWLAEHEEVFVQRVLKADPPVVLSRLELAISKCRAGDRWW